MQFVSLRPLIVYWASEGLNLHRGICSWIFPLSQFSQFLAELNVLIFVIFAIGIFRQCLQQFCKQLKDKFVFCIRSFIFHSSSFFPSSDIWLFRAELTNGAAMRRHPSPAVNRRMSFESKMDSYEGMPVWYLLIFSIRHLESGIKQSRPSPLGEKLSFWQFQVAVGKLGLIFTQFRFRALTLCIKFTVRKSRNPSKFENNQ